MGVGEGTSYLRLYQRCIKFLKSVWEEYQVGKVISWVGGKNIMLKKCKGVEYYFPYNIQVIGQEKWEKAEEDGNVLGQNQDLEKQGWVRISRLWGALYTLDYILN